MVAYYYTRDHLGSVREMLNSSGSIVARYAYDANGVTTLVSGTDMATFGFAGMQKHPASGFYVTLARIYDAFLALWRSRDPMGEAGSKNLYGYVSNNPISFTDPMGLSEGVFTIYPDTWDPAPSSVNIDYTQKPGHAGPSCCQHVKLIQTVTFNYGFGNGQPNVDYPVKQWWNPFSWAVSKPVNRYPYYPYDNHGNVPGNGSYGDYPHSLVTPLIQILEVCAICDDTGQVLGCHRWAVLSGIGVSGTAGASGSYPAQAPSPDFKKATGY